MRTLEEKKILVNAICEYAPYEPCIANEDIDSGFAIRIFPRHIGLSKYIDGFTLDSEKYGECKADKTVIYLRPMSSMTEEEHKEAKTNGCIIYHDTSPKNRGLMVIASPKGIDWLRAHLFDYRGLIKKGIAKPIGTEKKFEG